MVITPASQAGDEGSIPFARFFTKAYFIGLYSFRITGAVQPEKRCVANFWLHTREWSTAWTSELPKSSLFTLENSLVTVRAGTCPGAPVVE